MQLERISFKDDSRDVTGNSSKSYKIVLVLGDDL